jgi:hypothetical protein
MVGYLDESYAYPAADEPDWTEGLDTGELTEVLRSTLHEEYDDSSDEDMEDALATMLDSMSAAEAFNFTSALNRIGNGASQLISDPAVASIAQTTMPVLGGAAGTLIGGPAGTALGGKLGSLAAGALPARPALAPPGARRAVPPGTLPPPGSAPAPAGGSVAAAQGLVLTQQPDVLRSLLATALGQYGRQTVSGVPVAQVLGLLSQVFGQAAADADELMYHYQGPDAAESVADIDGDPAGLLYADLLGADNLELAESVGWDWPDR